MHVLLSLLLALPLLRRSHVHARLHHLERRERRAAVDQQDRAEGLILSTVNAPVHALEVQGGALFLAHIVVV